MRALGLDWMNAEIVETEAEANPYIYCGTTTEVGRIAEAK